jgi:hypothetical protein
MTMSIAHFFDYFLLTEAYSNHLAVTEISKVLLGLLGSARSSSLRLLLLLRSTESMACNVAG